MDPWWAHEEAIRVTDIPRHVPPTRAGKRVSAATAFRWTLAGLGGVRLRRFKIGGAWHTTREELVRWSQALTSMAGGD